ncbi:MAG: hypothetical protein ACR2HQ_15610 [Ilumatobacteraceae bacterium]
MAGQPSDVLRIALSMRGGVSLAVWIGGAVQELDRLAHAPPVDDDLSTRIGGPPFYEALLAIGGFERAVIDVITGASAGGLNGVVLAASRAYGFDFGQCSRCGQLGDIELLTRDPTRRYEDPHTGRKSLRPESLMKGDEYFQERLADQLRQLISSGDTDDSVDEPFDLILSATLVNPTYERDVLGLLAAGMNNPARRSVYTASERPAPTMQRIQYQLASWCRNRPLLRRRAYTPIVYNSAPSRPAMPARTRNAWSAVSRQVIPKPNGTAFAAAVAVAVAASPPPPSMVVVVGVTAGQIWTIS